MYTSDTSTVYKKKIKKIISQVGSPSYLVRINFHLTRFLTLFFHTTSYKCISIYHVINIKHLVIFVKIEMLSSVSWNWKCWNVDIFMLHVHMRKTAFISWLIGDKWLDLSLTRPSNALWVWLVGKYKRKKYKLMFCFKLRSYYCRQCL